MNIGDARIRITISNIVGDLQSLTDCLDIIIIQQFYDVCPNFLQLLLLFDLYFIIIYSIGVHFRIINLNILSL